MLDNIVINWHDALTVKPSRKGEYPFLMCVEGTQHRTKIKWDGVRWIGSTGYPLTVLPGDKWAGFTKCSHDLMASELAAL
jgi:hypothetical protein